MANTEQAIKLTKRVVDLADLTRGRHYLWDSELRGFGIQIEPTGTKTYFVRYRTKGHGRDGTRKFLKLGRHGDLTPAAARKQAKIVLGNIAMGADPAHELTLTRKAQVAERDALSVQALGELFLTEHVEPKRRPKTAVRYEILLRRHVYPKLGKLPAHRVTHADVGKIHLSQIDTKVSANRAVAVISSMYAFAAKRGLIADGFNPAKGIEKYREEGRERYLTGEELPRLGTALSDAETVGIAWAIDECNPNSKHTPKVFKGQREVLHPCAVAAIRLLLFTGARLREILHLQWEHVDLERGLLFLPDSKTGKKTIVLNAPALAIIGQLRLEKERHTTRWSGGYVIESGVDGQPRADLKRPWAAVQRHAKIEGVRLHDLRHTFASIGAGASLGLPLVGKLLGHSQPQTTARYAHLDADPLRRAANVIGDQLTAALTAPPARQESQIATRVSNPSVAAPDPLWTDLVQEP
jgi:integrase